MSYYVTGGQCFIYLNGLCNLQSTPGIATFAAFFKKDWRQVRQNKLNDWRRSSTDRIEVS